VNIQLPHSYIRPFEPHGVPTLREKSKSDADIYKIISEDFRHVFKMLKRMDKEKQRSNLWLQRVAELMKFRALESGATNVNYEIQTMKDENDFLTGFKFIFRIVINKHNYVRLHLLWL